MTPVCQFGTANTQMHPFLYMSHFYHPQHWKKVYLKSVVLQCTDSEIINVPKNLKKLPPEVFLTTDA